MSTAADRARALWIALAIGVLAAVLRFPALGTDGLWVDEAYTVRLIDEPAAGIVRALRADDAPPLFYLLEKGALLLLGTSEGAARALPALLGVTLVVAGTLWFSRLGLGTGSLCGLLLATHPLLVFYARQARSYALLQLLSLALLAASLDAHRGWTRARAVVWGAIALALLYTHNLGVWTVLAGSVVLLPLLRDGSRRGDVATAWGVTAVGAIPWGLSLWGQLGVHGELNAWMGTFWEDRSLLTGPLLSLAAFTPGAAPHAPSQIGLPGFSRALPFVGPCLWAATLLALLGTLRAPSGTDHARAARATGVFVLLPLVGLVVTSWIVGPAYVVGRTDTLALAPWAILLALGIRAWWGERARRSWFLGPLLLAVLAGAGLLASLGLLSPRNPLAKGSDRALSAELAKRVRNGDALVHGALAGPTLAYYGERDGWMSRLVSANGFPMHVESNPAGFFPAPLDSLEAWRRDAATLRARWERASIGDLHVLAARSDISDGQTWPTRPTPPPSDRSVLTANELVTPMSVLVFTLVGLAPIPVVSEYRQDWVGGERVLLRIPRASWLHPDSLGGIEVRP